MADVDSTGQDHFRKLERMYAASPINGWFGPRIRVERGQAEVLISLRPEFHHPAGAVHGALYFKALDDATFFAANSLVEDVFVLTASFELEFLQPVVDGELRADARVIESGTRRTVAVGELHDSKGNLIARGTGSFARSKIPLTPAVQYS